MNKENYIKPALKAFEVKSSPLCGSEVGPGIGSDDQQLDSKSFSGGLIDDDFETSDSEPEY